MKSAIFRFIIVAAIVCLSTPFTPNALADTITLNDGRVFEGIIIQSDDEQLQIRTVISGIETVLTFKQDEILDRNESDYKLPDESDDSKNNKSTGKNSTRSGYMLVPFKGEIGALLNTNYLELVAKTANSRKPEVVIFEVDSTGGSSEEMAQISLLIDALSQRHRVVFYLKGAAYQTASILVFHQDAVYTTSYSAFGYYIPGQWPNAQTATQVKHDNPLQFVLDEIQNEKINGDARAIALAMVSPQHNVFFNKRTSPWGISGTERPGYILASSPNGYLSLTPEQLVGTEIAIGIFDQLQALLASLDLSNPDKESADGYIIFEQYKTSAELALKKYNDNYFEYTSTMQAYNNKKGGYRYNDYGQAIRAIRRVQRSMNQLFRQHKYIRLLTPESEHNTKIAAIENNIRLLEEKKRTAPNTRPINRHDSNRRRE